MTKPDSLPRPKKPDYYISPRWSWEILDCSMPLTFDTYSECSYRCLYCFSFFQKSLGNPGLKYMRSPSRPVDEEKIKRLFLNTQGLHKDEFMLNDFGPYIQARMPMQWGGLSDPFDENEREQGVTLRLLRFFRSIDYPLSMSTKGAWWSQDSRYTDLFEGAKNLNLKVSIITTNESMARRIEVLCPSPLERLKVIERIAKLGIGGVTLRLRPFIIGLTDDSYLDLIRSAASAGANAVSTEFLCLENRSIRARHRFEGMGRALGFDLLGYYRQNSRQNGYMRLNRKIKEPYIASMRDLCANLGLRFYVSDADFKECSANGSCCGLPESWNYTRGQFTEALLLAKKNGRVSWPEIDSRLAFLDHDANASGWHFASAEERAKFHGKTLREWMRHHWNNVNGGRGPYKYFGGILYPVDRDEAGDVIYEYRGQ